MKFPHRVIFSQNNFLVDEKWTGKSTKWKAEDCWVDKTVDETYCVTTSLLLSKQLFWFCPHSQNLTFPLTPTLPILQIATLEKVMEGRIPPTSYKKGLRVDFITTIFLCNILILLCAYTVNENLSLDHT